MKYIRKVVNNYDGDFDDEAFSEITTAVGLFDTFNRSFNVGHRVKHCDGIKDGCDIDKEEIRLSLNHILPDASNAVRKSTERKQVVSITQKPEVVCYQQFTACAITSAAWFLCNLFTFGGCAFCLAGVLTECGQSIWICTVVAAG